VALALLMPGATPGPEVVGHRLAPGLQAGEQGEHARMEIIVRLHPDVARTLLGRRGAGTVPGAAEVTAVLGRFGVELTPQHPGLSDPNLAAYFTVSAPSFAQAEAIAAALRELDAVEAAYIQPPPHPA
jgi:hypothetical protein